MMSFRQRAILSLLLLPLAVSAQSKEELAAREYLHCAAFYAYGANASSGNAAHFERLAQEYWNSAEALLGNDPARTKVEFELVSDKFLEDLKAAAGRTELRRSLQTAASRCAGLADRLQPRLFKRKAEIEAEDAHPMPYRARAQEMGLVEFDMTVVEIAREARSSTLNIPGFSERLPAASRWLMCVYTDLAMKRGFPYWGAVYPQGASEDVLVVFPESKSASLAETLGKELGKERLSLDAVAVDEMAGYCGNLRRPLAE